MNFIDAYIEQYAPTASDAMVTVKGYADTIVSQLDRIEHNTVIRERDAVDQTWLHPQTFFSLLTSAVVQDILFVPTSEVWELEFLNMDLSTTSWQVLIDNRLAVSGNAVVGAQLEQPGLILKGGSTVSFSATGGVFPQACFIQCKRLSAPLHARNTDGPTGADRKPLPNENVTPFVIGRHTDEYRRSAPNVIGDRS